MTFNICYHANVEKIKIDYGIVPAVFDTKLGFWKSEVSEEIFNNLKKKKIGYMNFFKKKDQVYFQIVCENFSDDMLEAERKLLKISEKYICSKIPFRFKYKKVLKKRINLILNS